NKVWVDADIQITPATATNAVGTNHTLTITVHGLNGGIVGSGTASASIVSGPATFVVGPTCNYNGGGTGTASCTVVIRSTTTGTSVVHAASTIPVSGVGRASWREGEGINGNDANKEWRDGSMQITPATATNAVGTNHTLTITVNGGNGTLGSGTATASIVSGPGTFVVGPTCNYTGGGLTASCTVVIRSTTTGTTQVHAASTIPVS